MSDSPDTGLDLEDLELQFLPAWAKQSPDVHRYAKFEGGAGETGPRHRDRQDRHERQGGRPDRRSRREGGSGGRPGPQGDRTTASRREGGRQGKPRREEAREPTLPLPEVSVSFVPEERGVESIAKQIKLTGRAYPIFDIAHLILRKPDRYHVTFGAIKKADGQIAQPLWVCNLDDTVWLSEQDALHHVLKRHFDTFYKAEKTPTDPPKGTYTFVAQCGLSGVILGPPNYHDYQNNLRKLHAERFSRMPFDVYKSKVRITKDEAVVKQWIEDQSWKTAYVCLNVPEPRTLNSREEVEAHFREVHLTNIVRAVESHTLNGAAAQQLPASAWRQLLRKAWDDQTRFPLKVVNVLSQQFAAQGLQFFKVNKTITHVGVARPHYLDVVATPVSDGVKRIVEYIDANPGCTRRQLVEALAPSPGRATATPSVDAPPASEAKPREPATAPGVSAASAESHTPSSEQTAVIADLHWLIHQGHVLEFANGKIETAKKPNPKPIKPLPKGEEGAGESGVRAGAAAEQQPFPRSPGVAAPTRAAEAVSAETGEAALPTSETTVAPANDTTNAAVTPVGESGAEPAPAELPTEGR